MFIYGYVCCRRSAAMPEYVMDVYEASVATGSERDLVLLRSTFLIFTSVGLDVSFSNV